MSIACNFFCNTELIAETFELRDLQSDALHLA